MTSPLLAYLTPEPRPDCWWRKPDALRAFAYEVLRMGDADHAARVHASTAEKPFGAHLLGEKGYPVVRIAALDGPTTAAIERAVGLASAGMRIPLGTSDVGLVAASLEEYAPYPAIASAAFRPVVGLRFASPTTFSQGGDRHLPLPLPDLMLRSWARRWNAFCPPACTIEDEALDCLCTRVALAGADVHTLVTQFARGKVVGFVGTATIEALRCRDWLADDRARFAALVAYSAVAGTGARTTQGMGLTRLEPGRRARPRAGARDG